MVFMKMRLVIGYNQMGAVSETNSCGYRNQFCDSAFIGPSLGALNIIFLGHPTRRQQNSKPGHIKSCKESEGASSYSSGAGEQF